MALTRLTDWNDGDTLTSAALEAEFDNIYSNALSLISPLTGNLAAGGNIITGLGLGSASAPSLSFTSSDTNTGIYSSAADTVDIAAGGVRVGKFNTVSSGVNYVDVTPAATGGGPIILGAGSDTNVDLRIRSQGTGAVLVQPGSTTSLSVNRVASAVNYVALSGAATGNGVIIDAEGSDTNIDVNYDTKGTGVHIFKVGATEKYRVNSYSKTTSFVVVSADQTATQSNTTLQDVTDLVFPLAASTQYMVRGNLFFTGANTTHDVKMGWTYPTDCTMKWGPSLSINTSTLANTVTYWTAVTTGVTPDALLAETDTFSCGSFAGTHGIVIYAIVTNLTNTGNLQFQFSQNSSSAADLKILKGSNLEIVKLQ